MAVKKEEKKALGKMWNKASSNTVNVAAGKYIFKIKSAKFNDGDKGPSIKSMLTIVGGNEEYIGEAISQFDNLATEQNMSFFKQKLQRLGIDIPEDFTEIEDGTVCEAMEGLTFEGELKINGGFVNIYVNKLMDDDGEDDSEEEEEEDDAAEGTDSEDDSEDEASEDEDSEDEDKEDGDKEEDAGEDEEEESDDSEQEEAAEEDEEESDEDDDGFPTPDEVAAMKGKEVNEVLKAVDIDPKEIAAPKKFLETMSNYLYTPKYTPEIDGFNAVVKGLGIKGLKGIKDSKEKNKIVKKAIEKLLS